MHDPTLASCCEKDQIAYEKAMALKTVLTAHDPTSQGVRTRQQLFQPPAAMQPKIITAGCTTSSIETTQLDDEDSEDSDFDSGSEFELDALMAERRKAMELQMQEIARNAADGYGVVLDVDASTLLQQLQQNAVGKVSCVAWLRRGAKAKVDAMAHVATRFIGTKFYAVTLRADDAALATVERQWRLSSASVSVVAFKDGSRVDTFSVDERALEDPSTLWEVQLLPWLTRCNVLMTERHDQKLTDRHSTKPRKDAEEDVDENAFDCGVANCRIRFQFEHEHVGPSQDSKTEISSWRA